METRTTKGQKRTGKSEVYEDGLLCGHVVRKYNNVEEEEDSTMYTSGGGLV